MLVWFRLGILVFISISVLCGIPDRLSSDCFWGKSMMWELGDGEAVCFRLISLFLSVFWLEKLMLSHGAFVVVRELSRIVYDV
jgi:hypothetical protein